MGVTTVATARQKRWVGVDCDICGGHYRCMVEAWGQASDSVLPISNQGLKEIALYNLEIGLQRKAVAIPCPHCVHYPSSHVANVRATAGRWFSWGVAPVLFVVLIVTVAQLFPKGSE